MKKMIVSCIFMYFIIFFVSKISYAKQSYTISSGDILEISIVGEQELTKQVIVLPDGTISFPFVGTIKVEGKTINEVKQMVEKKIRDYIPDAVAYVSIIQLGSLQYYVLGKVVKSGMYNVSKPITVLQALALAGGLTPFANQSKILIIRGHGKNTTKILFNYNEVKKGKHLEQNILLQRGDVILVP